MKLLKGMLNDLPGDPDDPNAVAPGLAIEGAVKPPLVNYIASDYYRLNLDDIARIMMQKTIAWEAFSVVRRVELAVLIVKKCEGGCRHATTSRSQLCRRPHFKNIVTTNLHVTCVSGRDNNMYK
jgi:hypothetical protein